MRGLDVAVRVVPELAAQRELQLRILEATVASWSSPHTDEHGLRAIDPGRREAAVRFMTSLPDEPVATSVTVDQLVDVRLLPTPCIMRVAALSGRMASGGDSALDAAGARSQGWFA